mgnify:CR=1 FL=1
MLHAARKVFSNVKSTMAEEWSTVANESINPIKPDHVKKFYCQGTSFDQRHLDTYTHSLFNL